MQFLVGMGLHSQAVRELAKAQLVTALIVTCSFQTGQLSNPEVEQSLISNTVKAISCPKGMPAAYLLALMCPLHHALYPTMNTTNTKAMFLHQQVTTGRVDRRVAKH